MARMIPAHIPQDCPSEGEKEVFHLLKNDPKTNEWIVLHSLDIASQGKQTSSEVDFIVIVPQMGVVVLEVKGCKKIKRKGGEWFYGNNPAPDLRGPFKQAESNMHCLLDRLRISRPLLSGIVFSYAVIFPFTDFVENSFEWNPWNIINNKDLGKKPISDLIISSLGNARIHWSSTGSAVWFHPELHEPTIKQCEEIADFFRPDFEFYESPNSRKYRLEKEIKRYTEEQFTALDAMENNERVVFAGPAGTGKTLLAIETARRSSNSGQRVFLLCFNKLLAEMLKLQTECIRPLVKCTTIHDHMLEMSGHLIEEEEDDSDNFWTDILPAKALEKIRITGSEKYEVLILDEAQDILCKPLYIEYLNELLNGGIHSGTWRFFGDFEQQTIFGKMPVNLKEFINEKVRSAAIYNLRTNCRNTRKIAELARTLGGLEPDYKRILRPEEGAKPVTLYYKDKEDQKYLLIEALNNLYSKGMKGSDIAILSTRSNKNCIAATITDDPWKNRIMPLKNLNEGCIRYASIYRFKGLESPAVIVTDINDIVEKNAPALLYVAITRALHELFILVNEKSKQAVEKNQ